MTSEKQKDQTPIIEAERLALTSWSIEVTENGCGAHFITDGNGCRIATVDFIENEEEEAANARLIAAAPTLLKALIQISRDAARAFGTPNDYTQRCGATADAAIANALGRI
jgi:hypothetical protein